MKIRPTPLMIAVGILAAASLPSAHATLLVQSNFDTGYTAGNALAGQSGSGDLGLSGTYSSVPLADTTLNVVSGGLNYSSGSIVKNGGANSVNLTTTNGDAFNYLLSRSFDSVITGQDIFFSVVFSMVTASANPTLTFGLNSGGIFGSNTPYLGISAGNYAAGLGGVIGTNAISSTTAADGQLVMLVGEYIWNDVTGKYDGVNLYLNPSSATPGMATASQLGIADGPSAFDRFTLDGVNLGTFEANFDSFAVGTSFADVVPEPSAFALLAIGAGVLAFRRRKANTRA